MPSKFMNIESRLFKKLTVLTLTRDRLKIILVGFWVCEQKWNNYTSPPLEIREVHNSLKDIYLSAGPVWLWMDIPRMSI